MPPFPPSGVVAPNNAPGPAGAGGPDLTDAPDLGDEFVDAAVTGLLYFEMMRGSNVVRIAPDPAGQFPTEQSVTDGLRLLAGLRRVLTAGAATADGAAKDR